MSQSKNDAAWEKLFQTHNIIERVNRDGVYEISAVSINKRREARLMTKFDHHIQLPTLFQKHTFTIQPNSRGIYLIGRFASYQKARERQPRFVSVNLTRGFDVADTLLPSPQPVTAL